MFQLNAKREIKLCSFSSQLRQQQQSWKETGHKHSYTLPDNTDAPATFFHSHAIQFTHSQFLSPYFSF